MKPSYLACLLFLPACAMSATPTFNSDIAPILYQQCAPCHRPGQVAPFPLLTYHDAAKRAGLIAAVTAKRLMPPWKAEAGFGHFQGERRLSDAQIDLIREWAEKGAPEGDPERKPSPPEFDSAFRSGKPDAVLMPADSFPVPADGQDIVQCFVVPAGADADRFVKTVEFRPGNPRVVHHALLFLDNSGAASRLDAATPEPGYPCFGSPGFAPSGALGGWAPGATPQTLFDGMALRIAKGSDLVIQTHYHPSGKPETDRSSVALTFTDRPRRGMAHMIVGTRNIDLPAGDPHYVVSDWVEVPQDVELVNIAPHAHLLCKEMKVEAKLPDGSIQPLIWIKDWDFNWQGEYRYAEPVKLPKGTRVELHYVYDNSTGNPRNPSSPPRPVTYGEQTTDEMALLFLLVAVPRLEDTAGFYQSYAVSRINQFLDEGGDPVVMTPNQVKGLRKAIPIFDKNHDGKLDSEERLPLFRFLKLIQ